MAARFEQRCPSAQRVRRYAAMVLLWLLAVCANGTETFGNSSDQQFHNNNSNSNSNSNLLLKELRAQLQDTIGKLHEQVQHEMQQLQTSINGLEAGIRQVKGHHAGFETSLGVQYHDEAMWRRSFGKQLSSLHTSVVAPRDGAGTGAVQTKAQSPPPSLHRSPGISGDDGNSHRRRLTSEQCPDHSGPQLKVNGTCSCSEDMFVGEGRSLLELLQKFEKAVNTSVDELAVVSEALACPTVVGALRMRRVGSYEDADMNEPYAARVSDDGRYVYVTAAGNDGIMTIDVTEPNKPVKANLLHDETLLTQPLDMAMSPSGWYLLVVCGNGNALAILDVHTNTATPTILSTLVNNSAYMHPTGVDVSPDGKYAYVSGYDSDSLAVVNVANASAPFVLGWNSPDDTCVGAGSVATSLDGRHVYVSCEGDQRIATYDVATDPATPSLVNVTSHLDLAAVDRLLLSPDGQTLFATQSDTDSVLVLDIGSDPELPYPTIVGNASAPTGDLSGPTRGLAVSKNGRYLFATGRQSNSIVMFDVGSDRKNPKFVKSITNSTSQGGPRGVELSHDGNFLYVVSKDADTMSTVRLGQYSWCAAEVTTNTSSAIIHWHS